MPSRPDARAGRAPRRARGRRRRRLDEAFAADRPFVIDAVVDPDVPPLPPHITFEQARSTTSALLKGDPEARGILRQSFVQKLREYVH